MNNKEIHLVGQLGIPTSCTLDEIEALGTVGNPVIFQRKRKGTEYYNLAEAYFIYHHFVSHVPGWDYFLCVLKTLPGSMAWSCLCLP